MYPDGPVLIFSGVRGDTRRYRSLHLYEQLRLAGVDCAISHLTDPRLPELARTASAAILHRVAFDRYTERLLAQLRKNNALVVLDADDFLYDPAIMRWIDSPDFQDPVRADLYRKELLRHRAMLEHCDAITVSTDYLAKLMEPFGKPVRIHRNAFNQEMRTLSERALSERALAEQAAKSRTMTQPERVVIGYASGTRTHDQDFALVCPALRAVLEKYPQTELWLMGPVDPGAGWEDLQERIKTFPLVPWRELPARLAQLDINLAPLLPESPFNQAKSEIKYMEAGLVRVPTIASPTDAFVHAIRSGENGLLAADSGAWQAALEQLVTNPPLRQAIGTAAYQDVLQRYAPLERGRSAAEMIIELAAQCSRRAPFSSPPVVSDQPAAGSYYFTTSDEAHPTLAELARYSIRHRGVQTLLGQVWVYFRRKLAPIFPFHTAGRE